MNIKTDTKEKFTTITPEDEVLTANMTDEIVAVLNSYLNKKPPHIILNLTAVVEMDEQIAETIVEQQQKFYDQNCSFVICCISAPIEKLLDNLSFLEFMNITPTESEAWDIVQMEEIERELLGNG